MFSKRLTDKENKVCVLNKIFTYINTKLMQLCYLHENGFRYDFKIKSITERQIKVFSLLWFLDFLDTYIHDPKVQVKLSKGIE